MMVLLKIRSRRYLSALFMLTLLGLFLNDARAGNLSAKEPVIMGTVFTVSDPSGDAAHWQQLAADIWPLSAGDFFSAEKLNTAVETLKKSGLFRRIEVSSRETGDQITLSVTLLPFDRIRDIRIRGEYPLFEKEIRRVMTLFVGDTFAPEDLPRQTERITALFKQQGYPTPGVSVTAHHPNDRRQVIIQVDIDKGDYLSVGRITITGNRVFSDFHLKAKMKTGRNRLKIGSAGRFIAADLKKDIRQLSAFYKKKGYIDVTIDHQVRSDIPACRVDIVLSISEGNHYTAVFDGNRAVSDRRLKKELVMFRRAINLKAAVRKSIRNIRELYSRKGYLRADVRIDRFIDAEKREVQLHVRVNEGPQTLIRTLRITGNRFISEKQIRAGILSRPPGWWHDGHLVPPVLAEDISAIHALYLKEGFPAVRIEKKIDYTPSREQADIRIDIDEGVRTIVDAVYFTGLAGIHLEEARKAIKLSVGSPFRQYMVTSDANSLSALISERGYPHVTVRGDVRFSDDRRRADIAYHVTPGPPVRVGAVDFTGNFRTRERVLRRAFSQKPTEPLSLKKTLEEVHALQTMDIFDSVHIQTLGLESRAETVDLLVNVAERKPFFFEAGSGYATDKGVFAHAKVGDRNLLGLNKSIWLDGTIGQTGHRAAIGFTEPRFLGFPILADLGLHTERIEAFNQTFGTTLYGGNLKLSIHPRAPLSLGWGLRYEYRDQFRREACSTPPCEDDPDLFRPRSLLVTSPSLLYDTRDSFIRPHRGIFSTFTVDVSKGLTNSLDDFIRYRFDLRLFYTPFSRLTLALRGQTGYIDTYGSTGVIPDDQLFFLGGIGNIRGFSENRLRFDENGDPVGGRQAISASFETRFDLGLNLELALFFDTGRVSDTFGADGSSRFRSSVGGGFRYITPIGPIGLVYGRKLDPLDGESDGRFHFSIGYSF